MKESLEEIAGIHKSLEQVSAMKSKHVVAENLVINAVIPVSSQVQAVGVSIRVEDYLTRNNLSAVFLPGGSGKAGPGKAIATSMLTALKFKPFRDLWQRMGEVLTRTRWRREVSSSMKQWKPRINRRQAGMNVAATTSHRPRKAVGSRHHRLHQRPRGVLLEHLLTDTGSAMAPTGKSIASRLFSPTEAG